jgi:hypothetical protein
VPTEDVAQRIVSERFALYFATITEDRGEAPAPYVAPEPKVGDKGRGRGKGKAS